MVRSTKSFAFNNQLITTDYLDGFVYTTPYSLEIEMGLQETPASEEMAAAGQRESFELAEKAIVVDPGGPIGLIESVPNFFATAEGFYDYENFRYIYQYKDHLGNTRLNFGRDKEGELFTEDSNDYYPFGLNFINPVSRGGALQVYNPSATYKNYKYNGKELQETGMYDYGARFYMPDIGRWGVMDPLAEVSKRWTPYNYAYNNPIMFVDPDGMLSVSSLQEMWDNTSGSSTWTNSGNGSFDGGEDDPKKKNARKAGSSSGMSEKESLKALVTIDGKKYHKNTGNLGAEIGNKINSFFGGDDDYFVEHKEYNSADDRFIHEAVNTSAGALAGGVIGKVAGKGFGMLFSKSKAFNPTSFADEIISINAGTEGGGMLLNGSPSSAINSAMYYDTAAEQGASIFRSISHGHMFVDGNKRTAVQAFMYFARQNGLKTVPVQQIYNIANKVATGQITEVSQISKMLVK